MDAVRTFPGYEGRRYEMELGCWSVPRKLMVPGAISGDRNLVLVPERRLVDDFDAFREFSFSNLLGERFVYIPREGLRIDLVGPSVRFGGTHKAVLRFAVLKWAKQSPEEFPPELICLSELYGPAGNPMQRTLEIQTAVGRALKE